MCDATALSLQGRILLSLHRALDQVAWLPRYDPLLKLLIEASGDICSAA